MKKSVLAALTAAFILAMSAGAVTASVEEYKKAVELNKTVINLFNLGLAYYKESRYAEAVETLKKTLETDTSDKEAHAKVDFNACQMIGIIQFNYMENDDEAIKYFVRAIELNPSNPDTYYYIGLSYLRKEQNDKALESFLEAIKKGISDTVDVNFRIGQIYYKQNIYGDAIQYFEKVIALKKDHIEARELLGLIYHKRNNPEKAIENFQAVVKARPDDFNASYILGLNYFKLKQYEKMILSYKRAIEINPNFADAHYNLGMAYFYRNMYEDAITELETAKKLNPGDSSVYSLIAQAKTQAYEYRLSNGTIYFTEDDLLKARQEFELALKAKPGDSEAEKYLKNVNEAIKAKIPERLAAAKSYFEAGKYAEAYNEWDFVLQADPGNSGAREGLARIEKNLSELVAAKVKIGADYEAKGKYAAALQEYREANKVAPKTQKASISAKISAVKTKLSSTIKKLLVKASAAEKEKSYRSALENFNEVLKYEETNDDALNGITRINQKIESDKEKYLALGKQNKSSNREKAISYFKKVLALDPGNEEAGKSIQELTGKQSQVSIDAKQIRVLYYEGVDKYVSGDIENAISIWNRVLKLDPNHAEAQKNIARAKEKLAAIKRLGGK